MLNGIFSGLADRLPSLLLGLPVILFSLSFHEMAHGYAALRLGDPTARNLGRLTLNPLKHIHPIGFLCMVLFHFGWANPVPINTRNFKNPRRDMALSSAAGPLSNVVLALVFAVLLRLSLWGTSAFFLEDVLSVLSFANGSVSSYSVGRAFPIIAILIYMLYLGVIINFSYALFNLIPIPPLDGSRIFYVFLPPKWYFAVMKYEQIIMIVMLLLLWNGWLLGPLQWLVGLLEGLTFSALGMRSGEPAGILSVIQYFIYSSL